MAETEVRFRSAIARITAKIFGGSVMVIVCLLLFRRVYFLGIQSLNLFHLAFDDIMNQPSNRAIPSILAAPKLAYTPPPIETSVIEAVVFPYGGDNFDGKSRFAI